MYQRLNSFLSLVFATMLVSQFTPPAQAADYQPAVTYDSFMKTKFYPSGSLVLSEFDIAFIPDAPVDAQVAVVDKDGKAVGGYRFYPDYSLKHGVIGRLKVEGSPMVELTEPGVYGIVVVIDGKPVSRFPFALQKQEGDDPFNPTSTYSFKGLWERLAYFGSSTYRSEEVPELNLWLGGMDMIDPGSFQAGFMVELKRGDDVIAHSKRRTNTFGNGHYKAYKTLLFQPHDVQSEPNAIPVAWEAVRQDGAYEVLVTRNEDEALLRVFKFEVAGGQIVPMPQTETGYEPHLDYMVPRSPVPSSSAYEFREITWISAGQ